jgi:sec-independent protein translocase protein TatA
MGMTEIMIIGGIALLIFGPSQLPKLGRSIGSTIKEFRGAGKELTKAFDEGSKDERD